MAIALVQMTRGQILDELNGISKAVSDPTDLSVIPYDLHLAGEMIYGDFWDRFRRDVLSGKKGYTRDRGTRLVLDWQDGYKEVGDEITSIYRGMPESMVRRIGPIGSYIEEDFIQEGLMGLFKAAGTYDLTKRVQFSSYAWYEVSEAIILALRGKARMIRITYNKEALYLKLREAERHLMALTGQKPSLEKLAEKVEAKPDRVMRTLDAFHQCKYVGSMDGADYGHRRDPEELTTLHEIVPDREAMDPEEFVLQRDFRQSIGEGMKLLPEKDREVIRLKFGLTDDCPMTLSDIGEELGGVTHQRAGQYSDRGLIKLRSHLKRKGHFAGNVITERSDFVS